MLVRLRTAGQAECPSGGEARPGAWTAPPVSAPSQPEQARGPKPDSQGRAGRVPRPGGPPTPFVGIDVSKDRLDVHVRPTGEAFQAGTRRAGLRPPRRPARRRHRPGRVVLEATGGYEAPVVAALAAAGLPVVVVNPRQVRRFAEATGRLAKTDPLDAAVLAHFAEAVRPAVRPLPDADTRALAALVARRRQLIEMRTAEQNRLATGRRGRRPRHPRPHRLAEPTSSTGSAGSWPPPSKPARPGGPRTTCSSPSPGSARSSATPC